MPPKLLEKLMSAGRNPAEYGIGEGGQMKPEEVVTAPGQGMLLEHLSDMSEMVEVASLDEVMMFISNLLKIKGF